MRRLPEMWTVPSGSKGGDCMKYGGKVGDTRWIRSAEAIDPREPFQEDDSDELLQKGFEGRKETPHKEYEGSGEEDRILGEDAGFPL